LKRSRDNQRVHRRSSGARDREQSESPDAQREHAPSAVDVAERATDQNQRAEGQQVRVRDPLLSLEAPAEVVLYRGQRDIDDRSVD